MPGRKKKRSISPEMKARLREVGKWREFYARWRELIADGDDENVTEHAMTDTAPEVAKEFGMVFEGGGGAPKPFADLGGADGAEEVVAKLSGKSCSTDDAIEWAFVSACVGKAAPEDAPSAVAWSLYRRFRANPAYMDDLSKSAFMSKMKREGVEDSFGRDGFDGDSEYSVLEAMGSVANEGGAR